MDDLFQNLYPLESTTVVDYDNIFTNTNVEVVDNVELLKNIDESHSIEPVDINHNNVKPNTVHQNVNNYKNDEICATPKRSIKGRVQ